MYSIKGHIIRLLYLYPFHFFFTVFILLNILYSYLLSGKIKKYKKKYNTLLIIIPGGGGGGGEGVNGLVILTFLICTLL